MLSLSSVVCSTWNPHPRGSLFSAQDCLLGSASTSPAGFSWMLVSIQFSNTIFLLSCALLRRNLPWVDPVLCLRPSLLRTQADCFKVFVSVNFWIFWVCNLIIATFYLSLLIIFIYIYMYIYINSLIQKQMLRYTDHYLNPLEHLHGSPHVTKGK